TRPRTAPSDRRRPRQRSSPPPPPRRRRRSREARRRGGLSPCGDRRVGGRVAAPWFGAGRRLHAFKGIRERCSAGGALRRRGFCYARLAVAMIAFLTDRRFADALPSLLLLGLDVKTEPLGRDAALHVRALAPSAIIL